MANKAQSKPALAKTAVDAAAEDYWSNYFHENGYGKLWTRKIPMRVTAALAKAASADAVTVAPLAFAPHDHGLTVEGICRAVTAGKASDVLFVADFDHEGNLTAFSSVAQ